MSDNDSGNYDALCDYRLRLENETLKATVAFWQHQCEYLKNECVKLAHELEAAKGEKREGGR